MIIHLILDGDQKTQKGLEVLLLDRDMKVVLKSAPDETKTAAIAPHEQYPLRGYGTEHLRRNFNTSVSTLDDNPIYHEITQLIIAFTIVKSSTLRRVAKPRQNEKPKDNLRCLESLERWRIFHAADLIFYDIPYDRAEIDSYIQLLKIPLLQEISLPNSLELYIERRIDAQGIENAEDKKLNLAWIRRELELLMVELATLTLTFAHVSEIKDCYAIPLVFDINSLLKRSSIYEQLFDGDPITLEEATIFYHLAGLLVGSSFASKDHKNSFLISDFGWSTFLNCCKDSDPAKVRPELIHVRIGVPTNALTLERKSRVEDTPTSLSSLPDTTVLDRGEQYVPRCEMGVTSRTEYFTSHASKFLLSIRFEIDHLYQTTSRNAETYTSYRKLHRSLWTTYATSQHKQCMHPRRPLLQAKLGFGVAAAKGYGWSQEGREQGSAKVVERICICLVEGDQRARWLAVEDAAESWVHKTMVRGDECCEKCALDAVAALPEKWILVL